MKCIKRKRAPGGGRKKIHTRCPYCRELLGVREMREHWSKCARKGYPPAYQSDAKLEERVCPEIDGTKMRRGARPYVTNFWDDVHGEGLYFGPDEEICIANVAAWMDLLFGVFNADGDEVLKAFHSYSKSLIKLYRSLHKWTRTGYPLCRRRDRLYRTRDWGVVIFSSGQLINASDGCIWKD